MALNSNRLFIFQHYFQTPYQYVCIYGNLTRSNVFMCSGVLERYPNFPDGFKESRNSMGKYRSIETDPTMTVEQKLPYMVEWWMEGIEAMKGMECDLVAVDKYLQLNQQPLRYLQHLGILMILFNLQ